ncbi:MAG: right-handed parallel beta-helix repeat-containing protein [Phycisphaerales bacterium]|nr:MAG: right-handed parallel beta-helix repeat-containing protein [Phycisphaerales bacterium]
MDRIGLVQFGLAWLLVAALASGTAGAYEYADNFETDKAQTDSYAHSPFWTSGTSPLPQPYLYYLESGGSQAIGFLDYKDRPAELGYSFPLEVAQGQKTVRGTLQVDVSFPTNETISQFFPGSLTYKVSSDGTAWSAPISLGAGRQTVSISSTGGTCYIVFSGIRAVIDNLRVSLSSPTTTIRVPGNFPTIQAALDFAGHGDVIEVGPGTYTGEGNWDLEFHGKSLTLRGANGPESTIIDCDWPASGADHRAFYFHQGETNRTLVCGFTIKGGHISGTSIPSSTSSWPDSPSHPIGGGIYCEFSSPTIADCIITDCHAEIGGGIGGVGTEAVITGCVISECAAGGFGAATTGGRGGAIGLIGQSNAMIANCDISDNATHHASFGAGVYCWQSAAVISGCRITSNSASGAVDGGGAYCGGAGTDVLFQNCIFSNNIATAGAGIFAEWAASSQRPLVSVVNCTIAQNQGGGIKSDRVDIGINSTIAWNNQGTALALSGAVSQAPVVYSNIQGGYSGTGNIKTDPLFVSLWNEDYHLQSSHGRYDARNNRWITDGRTSPCIDAGDPSDPGTEEPTPNGGRINMGAYGGTREASKGIKYLTYHVDAGSGRDGNNGLSPGTAFKTIQRAINAARSGDTILVWPGTYREDLNLNGKGITVQSAADAAVIVAENAYAFSFYHAESSKSIVSNFVIQGGSEAAILCAQGASPTLRNLTIVNSVLGISAYDGADPYIVNCIFWNNSDGDLFNCEAYFSCVEHDPPDASAGNISTDPQFADPDNGDFHLKSRYGRYVPDLDTWTLDPVQSPCIDGGDPDEYPRVERMHNGTRVNMGAYGGTPYASLSGSPPP